MMISTKRHVQQLASLFLSKKIFDIVLCPGSRNGPLIHTLAGCGQFDCRVIVDERSAGYFALGYPRQRKNRLSLCAVPVRLLLILPRRWPKPFTRRFL
ncbi:hypothetical protein [uncultured Desulfobacter sp.]|uniref:hypothetical protein n=1 Tax=uncultured Desulfobacter sp. TaxID=240139 RepID=UPI0029C7E790|nr:hypothetical protein [uncultured Desulfobacter sp.]